MLLLLFLVLKAAGLLLGRPRFAGAIVAGSTASAFAREAAVFATLVLPPDGFRTDLETARGALVALLFDDARLLRGGFWLPGPTLLPSILSANFQFPSGLVLQFRSRNVAVTSDFGNGLSQRAHFAAT